MEISFIFSSLWLSGGIRDTIEHANRFAKRNHSVTFIIPWGTFDPDMKVELAPEIKVIEAKINHPVTNSKLNLFEKILLSWRLAVSTPKSDFIITTHTPTTIAGFIASHILRRGKLAWHYQDYIEMYNGRPIETWLAKNALCWHEIAFVLSQDSKEELLRNCPTKTVIVSGAGISQAELFKPLPRVGMDSNDHILKILFLGDMRPRKGLYDFLEACEIVQKKKNNIHLWIVSKDDCQIDTNLSFEYIHRPSRDELARLYATCDLFVSASWWESFGLPPIEAMACGAPVVMTATRGGMEYALDGFNCLIVPPREPKVLAEAILRVLNDDQLKVKFRKNGPESVTKFSWDEATDRFETALMNQLKN